MFEPPLLFFPWSGNHLGEPPPAPSEGARKTEEEPFLDRDAANLPGAGTAPRGCPLSDGEGTGGEGDVGESGVWCQLAAHPRPAGQTQMCTDGNVFTATGPFLPRRESHKWGTSGSDRSHESPTSNEGFRATLPAGLAPREIADLPA